YNLGLVYFLQDALFSTIYFSIFILSVFIGLNIKANQQKKIFNLFLAMLVFVGCISVLMALNQRFMWLTSDLLFSMNYGNRATANLAQPNQLSTLLIISLFSLFYLYQNQKINKIMMYGVTLIFLIGIVMTQSRSAWASCIVLSVLYLYFYHRKTDVIHVLKLNTVFVGLTLNIPSLLNFLTSTQSSTAIDRLQDGSTRFRIWPQLIHAAMNEPWTGYGWGQVSVAQLSTMTSQSTQGEWFTYSHNLFLDIMLWNGLIFGTVISLLIIYLLYHCYVNLKSKQDLLLFLGFMAFFVHSCLEYPYAYTYLLIPSGIFLGYISYQQQLKKGVVC
ncbi:O-antigen ligase family protein, partial [Acinetobacter ursingii]|uniref:O-antigen ligase family protein n=2 Tax=Acinetobacter ursingii TaxID=108980 RepID=UPI001C09DA7D